MDTNCGNFPEVTNTQRAHWAELALRKFANVSGMEWENDQTRLTDLLADLMHFCHIHRRREDCPMDFECALDSARMHFEAELKEDV